MVQETMCLEAITKYMVQETMCLETITLYKAVETMWWEIEIVCQGLTIRPVAATTTSLVWTTTPTTLLIRRLRLTRGFLPLQQRQLLPLRSEAFELSEIPALLETFRNSSPEAA